MMRKSSIPLLSRPSQPAGTASSISSSTTTFTTYSATTTQQQSSRTSRTQRTPRHTTSRPLGDDGIPSIRLISATPSAAGDSSMNSSNYEPPSWNDIPVPVPSVPAPLLPSSSPAKRRLVPKKTKSKLNILSSSSRGASKEQQGAQDGFGRANNDFSDVVRRVGSIGASSRGFEIHVDSTCDPDLGELVVVKKKKSRAALDGMGWGALGDVTNVPKASPTKEKEAAVSDEKSKEGSGRWWALGRGRKDSKDKEKEKTQVQTHTMESVQIIPPTQSSDSRGRFNSLDSGLLLDTKTSKAVRGRVSSAQMLRIPPSPVANTFPLPQPTIQPLPEEQEHRMHPYPRSITPTPTMSYAHNPFASLPPRSATPTPTMNGLLAPPTHMATIPVQPDKESFLQPGLNANNGGGGSIAVRAMRSMRSMARLGGWAKGDSEQGPAEEKKEKERTVKVSSSKSKKENSKESKENSKKSKKDKESKSKTKDKGTVREKKSSVASSTLMRMSSSSFEAGALTASPSHSELPSPAVVDDDGEHMGTLVGKKKKSMLGLGLGRPSTMRLPSINRNASSASSNISANSGGLTSPHAATLTVNRLSTDTANGILITNRARSGSGSSSLRPTSTCSGLSRNSSNSGASVRWDEACLHTAKERRRTERKERRASREQDGQPVGTEKTNRHSAEGRRRTSLMDIWPETRNSVGSAPSIAPSMDTRASVYSAETTSSVGSVVNPSGPVVTLEEATADGHSVSTTPPRKARARPVSEQMLGKSRPVGMYEAPGAALSILDAATNDLALLINTLDLEATPHTTPDMTPHRRRSDPQESPTKFLLERFSPLSSKVRSRTLRPCDTSITSLRSAAAAMTPEGVKAKRTLKPKSSMLAPKPEGNTEIRRMVSQQIAPWPAPNTELSPLKIAPKKKSSNAALQLEHELERTAKLRKVSTNSHLLDVDHAPESSPMGFQPLRPATNRRTLNVSPIKVKRSRSPALTPTEPVFSLTPTEPVFNLKKDRITSMMTFGSSSTSSRNNSLDMGSPMQPVFTAPTGHKRKQSSLSQPLPEERSKPPSPTFGRETKKALGLKGTMGESSVPEDVSMQDGNDSDIPDELQAILGRDSPVLLPGLLLGGPPAFPLPSPHGSATNISVSIPSIVLPPLDFAARDSVVADSLSSPVSDSDHDDTKKSFDFTGEIKRLNESGVSHRRSFIDQLEHAFKTPAKVDLRYGFEVEGEDSFYRLVNGEKEEVPPVPKLDPKYLSVGPVLGVQGHLADTSMRVEDEEDEEDEDLTTSSRWSSGDGELNRSFRFGGMSSQHSTIEEDTMDVDVIESETKPPLTLSDIIPPPGHSPTSSISATDEDSVLLKSIYDKAHENEYADPLPPMPRPRVNSDTSIHRMSTRMSRDSFFGPSARSSVASFTGFESFEQVRRGFEFHDYRPNFYPPAQASMSYNTTASRRVLHSRHESTFTVASISSVGHVLNHGVPDPFDYGLPVLAERPSSENLSCLSGSIDDTFSFMQHIPQRQRADSDASSFYFRASAVTNSSAYKEHRRRESAMSVNSFAPPVSLYNRSFGANRSHHVRNDSSSSFSSLAHNYAMHPASGGRAAWARHRQDASVDSVASDFSAMRLGRPGLGDKMFDTAAPGAPLTSIMASPLEDIDQEDPRDSTYGRYGSSYDSLMDGTHQSSAEPDSLFEQTGYKSEFVSDDSVFFDASSRCAMPRQLQRAVTEPHGQLFRPLSMMSFASEHPPEEHDDTMISMLGGGHVRRMSVGSVVNGSPCVNKRKYSHLRNEYGNQDFNESPKKARIVEKPSFAPSIASTSSFKFGEERMIRVTKGHFHRDSLEENCLTGEGEDHSGSFQFSQVFSRPLPARSRSSTVTTSSSGGDTPPLSSYDSSSQSEGGSISSIDLAHVNSLLANATHPMTVGSRARSRARGAGHRRFSQARMSRSSVYETIEEEQPSVHNSPAAPVKSSPTIRQAVYIVDPESPEYSMWDDDQGIEALRKYYALRDEANDAVEESKKTWHDTPFSVFALQSFAIPKNPTGMEALLEHSIKNYGPLPYRLRQRTQSRTSSRASPYPSPSIRSLKTASPQVHRSSPRVLEAPVTATVTDSPSLPLQPIRQNRNIPQARPSLLPSKKPWESPEVLKPTAALKENGLPLQSRQRVGSGARRVALGWSKRSNGPKSSTGQKENVAVGQGSITTPGEGLRISRPRPKGRPTPATARFARV